MRGYRKTRDERVGVKGTAGLEFQNFTLVGLRGRSAIPLTPTPLFPQVGDKIAKGSNAEASLQPTLYSRSYLGRSDLKERANNAGKFDNKKGGGAVFWMFYYMPTALM